MTLTLAFTAEDAPRWLAGPDYELPGPEAGELALALDGLIAPLADALRDTRLEGFVEDLAWALVNVFHRKAERLARRADGNGLEIRRLQREQDGSEIADTDLQTAIVRGQLLDEATACLEAMRDHLAEAYDRETGRAWFPRSGSMTGRTTTAATIDARDFLAARRQAALAERAPEGTYIAVAGGPDYEDHVTIWNRLDRARARFADMVLLHGGNARGAERIAAAWARARGIAQVVFRPDFVAHGRAAPFRRNDALLEARPRGLILFPGNGITGNLGDKARARGVKVWEIAPEHALEDASEDNGDTTKTGAGRTG